jgi:hypothetical protein
MLYNFSIKYWKGSLNLADGLLRRLDYESVELTFVGELILTLENKIVWCASMYVLSSSVVLLDE